MTCEEVRLALWPGPARGPRAAPAEAPAALRHYAGCSACQRFFAHQDQLGARLRRLASVQRAPTRLHNRVRAALKVAAGDAAAGHQRWRRGRRVALLGGLAAAAVAVLLLVGPPMSTTDHLARPFVEAALADVPDQTPPGADRAALARWFTERLGHDVFVMDMPDAELAGGYVTRVGDIPSAVLRYRLQGLPLTLVVVPGERVLDRRVADGEVITLASRGLEVLIWGEPGATLVVVASMAREELRAIAEECRRQMRAAV